MNPRTAKQELAPQYRAPKLVLWDHHFGSGRAHKLVLWEHRFGSGNRGLAPKHRGLRTPVFAENWCCGTPSGGVVGPPFLAETGVWEHHEQIQEKNNSIMGERERAWACGPCALVLNEGPSLRLARKKTRKQASIPVKPRRAHPAALHRGAIQQAARRRTEWALAPCPLAMPVATPAQRSRRAGGPQPKGSFPPPYRAARKASPFGDAGTYPRDRLTHENADRCWAHATYAQRRWTER
jgi:hypothetical protein